MGLTGNHGSKGQQVVLYHLGRTGSDGEKSAYLDPRAKPAEVAGAKAVYEHVRVVRAMREAQEGKRVEVEYKGVRQDLRNQQSQAIQADPLLAADGRSSSLRHMLIPDAAQRAYEGHVSFRGPVSQSRLSESASKVFIEQSTFFHGEATRF